MKISYKSQIRSQFKILIISFICLSSYFNLYTQNLPSKKQISKDGRMIISGAENNIGFYSPNEVKNLYLYFSQPNYWTLLTSNYKSETLLEATLKYEDITLQKVGVRFRGNTSYQQTGTSKKKSFAIETDFLIPDQTLLGYKNIKLNNSHQDPSFMREVLYSRMGVKHTPMAKTNYIHLYINDENWGVYANVQSIDKTFLEEWFLSNDGAKFRPTIDGSGIPGGGMPPGGMGQWGDGTAGMNYLGEDTALYQKYYTLKSSDIDSSWQKLMYATKKLNDVTNENYKFIEDVIDIDKTLWFLAIENIFTDDDSYIMKGKMDYMIYYEPETKLTIPLEYDGNSTMEESTANSTAWTPFKNVNNSKYPILNKLLQIKEYRSRYLAHYRTILNETFTTEKMHKIIDETNVLISDLVANDNKKLNTTNEYISSVNSLKNFVTKRISFVNSNSELSSNFAPKINSANHFTLNGEELKNPNHNERVTIKANISSDLPLNSVNLYYSTGLVGKFNKVAMFDDGNHNDNIFNDGIFAAEIPGFSAGTLVRYYVEAGVLNSQNNEDVSYLPTGAEHDVFIYSVNKINNPSGVVINEFMAQNSTSVKDDAGDFDDWIELYNNSNNVVDLSGYFLSDKLINPTKWAIPAGTIIQPNGYVIIWADEEPLEGALHCNFKISASTEVLTLINPNFETDDEVNFGSQKTDISYARNPNGIGDFVFQPQTFGANNNPENSVENLFENLDLNIYPNPVENTLNINFTNTDNYLDISYLTNNYSNNNNLIIEIYDYLGQKIISQSLSQNILQKAESKNISLDVSELSSGFYFLHFENKIYKFIKK